MASQGPNSGSTFVNDTSLGSAAWSDLNNAAASDNLYAYAVLGGNTTSYYLKATGFGFTIPDNATIDGIVVEVERSASGFYVRDARVYIVKGNALTGTNKANSTPWPSTDTYQTYGSPTDLWGTTWTPADINSTGFGVAISVLNQDTNIAQAYIDHIRITVYYTHVAGMHLMTQII